MASISAGYSLYSGTKLDIKKDFYLTHNNLPIFERIFNSEDSSIVNIENNTIRIPEHFFVSGEKIKYLHDGSPIGIKTTNIPGIGTTDKLPSSLYIIKVNDLDVQVSSSPEESLSIIAIPIEINSLGIGTFHKFISEKQNSKGLVSIDNVIQSPVVSTSITTILTENLGIFENLITVSTTDLFYGGELIKVNNEIMRIVSVGIGSTNSIIVEREIMGSGVTTHLSGELITKVKGNYNIVDNTIYFSSPPYGQVPILNPSNRPDEIDYDGLEINSTFSGRIFIRSGIPNSDVETYEYNYIFDDISNQFNGYNSDFTLTSDQQNISGFSTGNSITLINSIFQSPSRSDGNIIIPGNYTLQESSGITTITFIGNSATNDYDVNTSSLPRGGIIVSIASTKGFGYHPLVSAGGTAVVSTSGTIQSISIGNSGSGYRVGIQTIVNVGVQTESDGIPNIEYVGTASILNGHIVEVTISNPGSGYTSTNPPIVVFDDPLSYKDIPLIYSDDSILGVGTGSKVDIVVGQGSSVISFELSNYGFGYSRDEILTIPINGNNGIPTNPSLPYEEFQIIVDNIQNDEFSSWNFGDLQVLDPIDDLFNSERKSFPIRLNGLPRSIKSRPGSNIDINSSMLVFINDILQVPNESYTVNGSTITFNEAPKGPLENIKNSGDTSKILFYRGTSEIDTIDVDILETVKVGDNLRINSDIFDLKQRSRSVEEIKSTDIVRTNLYSKEGISKNELLSRPVIWCRQTEDMFINGKEITKDRIIYEPLIYPNTNIIKDIDEDSNEIFVDNVKTFFDNFSEFNSLNNKILIISQDVIVSASATAVVSLEGSIDYIDIDDGGSGYTEIPTVKISRPHYDFGSLAVATASIDNGKVVEISIDNSGSGYTSENPPLVLIESPKLTYEIVDKVLYEGDFGIVVGIETGSIGIASTALVFDFYIPNESALRDLDINMSGVSTEGISGIQTGYYFVISDSNIGFGLTSLDVNGNIIGIGTNYMDGIYQAVSVSMASIELSGIGNTSVVRVTTSVSDYNGLDIDNLNEFYGNYSWGRVYDFNRTKIQSFKSYNNGLSGISTSPIVIRYEPLKYRDYV